MTGINGKIGIVLTKQIGRHKVGETIEIEKYAGRYLVALGKGNFKNEADEFRRRVSKRKTRARKSQSQKDTARELVAE